MTKTELTELATKVFYKDEFIEILDLILQDNYALVQAIAEDKNRHAEQEVLDSVYKGDCDMVLFDRYRRCRIFDNAITQYREEDDTRP